MAWYLAWSRMVIEVALMQWFVYKLSNFLGLANDFHHRLQHLSTNCHVVEPQPNWLVAIEIDRRIDRSLGYKYQSELRKPKLRKQYKADKNNDITINNQWWRRNKTTLCRYILRKATSDSVSDSYPTEIHKYITFTQNITLKLNIWRQISTISATGTSPNTRLL